jgi:sugar fermentation stimulation protein A
MKLLSLKDYLGELKEGEFLSRANRFSAEVLIGGEVKKAHVSDTGRLRELLTPGTPVLVAQNPRGKLDFKLVAAKKEKWVFLYTPLHTLIAERIVKSGALGFKPKSVKREVSIGKSRIDLLIDEGFFLEVKGCNLKEGEVCLFPDAPTERGRRHLEELIKLKTEGKAERIGVLFLIARECERFRINDQEDPELARSFLKAVEAGLEVFCAKLEMEPSGELFLKVSSSRVDKIPIL